MPFGKYKDFKQCIQANKDKDNPKAYCATIHKKVTGEWPSQKECIVTNEIRLEYLHEKIVKPAKIGGLKQWQE